MDGWWIGGSDVLYLEEEGVEGGWDEEDSSPVERAIVGVGV